MSSDKPTILVVDDRPANRYAIVHALARSGFEVIEAESGREALELLKEHVVQLLISDVVMPVMDGFELCRIIKTDLEYSHIPVILLTAKNTAADRTGNR